MPKVLRLVFSIVNAVIIIGLMAIHFVVKEHTFQSSLLYYTFPLPVIISIILVLSIFLSKRFRKFNLLLSAILLAVWLSRSFKVNFTKDGDEHDLEVVFWNTSHEKGFKDIFEETESVPDVVVLVEYKGNDLEEVKTFYSNYHFYKHPSKEIGIFSKHEIIIRNTTLRNFSSYVIHFETFGLDFYAVDIAGSIDVPRKWGVDVIEEALTDYNNAILMGDFNMPYESKYLEPIKQNFNHAFNEKGNGFRETWFWNIPLLSLDHIWVSRDLEILKTEKISTWKSDHAILRTTLNKP